MPAKAPSKRRHQFYIEAQATTRSSAFADDDTECLRDKPQAVADAKPRAASNSPMRLRA
jgi:hypothetical protein